MPIDAQIGHCSQAHNGHFFLTGGNPCAYKRSERSRVIELNVNRRIRLG